MSYINTKTNKQPTLLTDLDGVSINWLAGFVNYMEKELGHKAKHQSPEHFTMIDIFPELDKPYLHVKDYQHTHHYRDVEPYPGAVEAYKKLQEMGVKIIAVTSCGEEEGIIKHRKYNIDKHFGDLFHDAHLLPLGGDKTDILSKYSNCSFIDDQLINVIASVKTGHKSYLWDMSYNAKEELPKEIIRARNWDIVIDGFKEELSNSNTLSKTSISRRRQRP